MSNRRPARHKQNNRSAVLAVVLLLAVLGLGGTLAAMLLPSASAEANGEYAVQTGPLQDVEVVRNTEHTEDEFHYLLNGSPVFDRKGKGGTVYLENSEGNSCFMQVVYRLEDGEEVYISPMLPPNSSLPLDDLDVLPQSGEYRADALIYIYPSAEADEYTECFEELITITVE